MGTPRKEPLHSVALSVAGPVCERAVRAFAEAISRQTPFDVAVEQGTSEEGEAPVLFDGGRAGMTVRWYRKPLAGGPAVYDAECIVYDEAEEERGQALCFAVEFHQRQLAVLAKDREVASLLLDPQAQSLPESGSRASGPDACIRRR